MESRCLYPVQLLPAGWSSICLWRWLRIKVEDKPPQLVTGPEPLTPWALTVLSRKMVKFSCSQCKINVCKEFVIKFSWTELWVGAEDGDAPTELIPVGDVCPSKSASWMLWFDIKIILSLIKAFYDVLLMIDLGTIHISTGTNTWNFITSTSSL